MNPYIEKEVLTQSDLKKVFSTFSHLRKKITLEEFEELFAYTSKHQNYKLFSFFYKDDCVALIGMRPYCDFVRKKHLYIDDLVVHENYRSKGLGTKLLEWIDVYAAKNNYKQIRLSTGIDNTLANKFYTKNSYKNKAIVFVKKMMDCEIK